MENVIALERMLRPALPTVIGNVDYTRFEGELKRMDELLRQSGVEKQMMELSMEAWQVRHAQQNAEPSAKAAMKHRRHTLLALRTMILKVMLGEDFRGLSQRLAECALFRWFCELDALVVKVPSKSTLQRYSNWIPAEQIRALLDTLTLAAAHGDEQLGLANALELEVVFLDSTCVPANIHFPIDWVLLRDAARTLIKAVQLIRKHGLKHRMADPADFLKAMNRLAMEMTHSRRQSEGKKRRKQVLRKMKKLSKVIANHAQRHRDLLQAHWAETDWSEAQAMQVIQRIDGILEKLPAAIEQAHERIIGERQVPNEKKRLSLYEEDIHVIVRGKSGAEVEFGNSLLLVEQSDGLIVDLEFLREQAPADSRRLRGSLDRLEELTGRAPFAVGGDRGFDSQANRVLLKEREIYNGICPKDPATHRVRAQDEIFQGMQHRRAQTEGRIGIFKNRMLNSLVRSKSYEHRAQAIHWAVLAHNLWLLARRPKAEVQSPPLAAAA